MSWLRRDMDVFESLSAWNEELMEEQWNTFTQGIDDSADFIFALQSPWQREKMIEHGQGMIMLDSSTDNTLKNCFLSDDDDRQKVCLYTIIIRDPLVGKGLPIAWALTTPKAEKPIAKVLRWLRFSTGLIPRAVMSDYNLVVTDDVTEVYDDLGEQAPSHYWCLFQVLNAFKRQAKTFLLDLADEATDDFREIAYSVDPPEPLFSSFYSKWQAASPKFVHHVKTQWQNNLEKWAVFFRTSVYQGILTNNYTKAWRRVLTSGYITPWERRRIDEVVQTLVDHVHTSYRRTTIQVERGFQRQHTNQFQRIAKNIADSYTKASLELLGIGILKTHSHFFISSFTHPTLKAYTIPFHEGRDVYYHGRVTQCNCEHYLRFGSASTGEKPSFNSRGGDPQSFQKATSRSTSRPNR
ncbi:hypothetical protein PTTG_01098 [Puccinia triticina 1-1 BBBD Race 1]|uniref:MULE transposase domain-containing protein n=1 Tax=Puccinia triticina (isolate 1-1 / race 1 (BBBD)) TaxID=630390 RepID=A0A180GZJ6_PUCT1|nr:hypothetical protein PTTG_01098 [Puccinia triticina 1-1 BBBD Race 1]